MRVVLMAAATLWVEFAAGIFPACGADNVPSIEGAWRVKESELGGEKLPPETFRDMVLVLKAGHYKVTGKRPDEGTYRIDTEANPHAIDITGTAGPTRGVTMQAIYELAEGVLRVCYDLSGKGRPTEFKTAGEPQFLQIIYERQKEP
jgi:uncharacterized protein (TIGR03067 family)